MPAAEAEQPKVVDIMAALEASVARRRRPGPGIRPRSPRGPRRAPDRSERQNTRAMSAPIDVDIAGRTVRLTNLDKVLYPSGFTKAEVVDYHARISPWIIPHLTGRCITFRRYPDGTDRDGFFEKRCPTHRPEWVPVALGPGDRRGGIEYCRIEEPAAMVWAANLAAIELHAPMALAADLDTPRTLVFDFDPGPAPRSSTVARWRSPCATCSRRCHSRDGARRRDPRACRCTCRSIPRA